MSAESLWGELPSKGKNMRIPYQYIDEQAMILTRTFKGKLEGNVQETVSSSGNVSITLEIVVSRLNGYAISVLYVSHPLRIYPLMLRDQMNATSYDCKNERQFLDALQAVLSSPKIKETILEILTLI